MEERSDSQLAPNEAVTIKPLQDDNAVYRARFIDLSAEEMQVELSSGLEVGSLLRLEFGNDLLVTEVARCEPREDEFTASLAILSRLEKSELKRLRYEALAGPAGNGPLKGD